MSRPQSGRDPDESAFLRTVGKRMKIERVRLDLSQEQLATKAGLSRNFVSSLERGAHGVDLVRLRRIARVLDVAWDALLPAANLTEPSEPATRTA